MCSSSESKEKLIDIESSLSDHYKVGEKVVVCGSLSMSRNAVLLAFAIPLILIVVWVVCGTYFLSLNEQMIMVGILIILVVYYLVLHFFNDKMSKSFSFWIKRPSS
jgi:sigma-E factor negative regulatory protein RseC